MGQPDVNVAKLIEAIQQSLNGRVVGYAGVVGGAAIAPQKFSGGLARTQVDGGALSFASSTMTGVGSVSKFVTAVAAVQLLDRPDAGGVEGWNILNATLDTAMYHALPPFWKLRNDIQDITFRDLLTHMSGLPAEGAVGEPGVDYFSLKAYLSPNPPAGSTPLGPRGKNAYSNVGFALFRLLLPNIVGLVSSAAPGSSAEEQVLAASYAAAYQAILNDNIWEQLGVSGPSQGTPPGNQHAFMYFFPGSQHGYDWSHWQYSGQTGSALGQPLVAGAGTLWVSIDQFTALIESITKMDGKVLTAAQWDHMQGIGATGYYIGYGFGIDRLEGSFGGNTYRWVEKNGGLTWITAGGAGQLSATVAFFGAPVPGSDPNQGPLYAALFMNSEQAGPAYSWDSWFFCENCNALFDPSQGNVCPDGKQPHKPGGRYILSTQLGQGEQFGWEQCGKCGALGYGGANAPSRCAAGGAHALTLGSALVPFSLNDGGQGSLTAQANWRMCKNCGVLAYAGSSASAGQCAAGGPHDFVLTASNYVLDVSCGADSVLWYAFNQAI